MSTWRIMLCGNPKYQGEFPNSSIVEVEYLAPILMDTPRAYEDGHFEVDHYLVDAVDPERHMASAQFLKTEIV